MQTLHLRKDKCLKHGLTYVYLTKGKGNYSCVKCMQECSQKKKPKIYTSITSLSNLERIMEGSENE